MLSQIILKNHYLKKIYIVFLKSILTKFIKKLQSYGNTTTLTVLAKDIYPVLLFLKKNTVGQFKVLVDIICYDCPGSLYRFHLIYNLLSIDTNYRVKVQTRLKEENPLLSTVTGLYPGAGWLEREVWDLYGVFFLKNLDLRRILTDYNFKGYPLRKDFPLSGFVEVVYDSTQKQVVYKNIDLSQNFRNFVFKNTWRSLIINATK